MHINKRRTPSHTEKFAVYQSDDRLLEQIERASDDDEGVAVIYLGQEGFVLKRRGFTIAIDPYLTDSVDRLPMNPTDFWRRRYEPPIAPHRLAGIDLVLCTHDHLDHIDPDTLSGIALASPQCRFAASPSCVHRLAESGIPHDRIVGLNALEPFVAGNARIHPIPAAHESYEQDENGHHRYFGYVIEWDGLCLYHAGDTLVTGELLDTLSAFRIDVGFLPINGRDLFRNRLDIAGNMNAREAADFAVALDIDTVVPMHYDLYPNNGEFPSYFVDYMYRSHPGRKFHLFQPGERWFYHKRDRGRPHVVVIGAGKTGRGFIARLAANSPFDIVFVERSDELVRRINEDGAYTVHFFDLARKPERIRGVRAAASGTLTAVKAMAQAAAVFTAVGEQNLPALAGDLRQALLRRAELGMDAPLDVITCENGVSPGQILRGALEAAAGEGAGAAMNVRVAEAAIFCSTVELNGTRLDILSESYDELPFDSRTLPGFGHAHGMYGMVEISDFKKLLRQKIYTYNCISACIAYMGAFKEYEMYADAANDEDIRAMLGEIIEPLNHAVSNLLDVRLEKQRMFARRAVQKFSDPNIRDDIARNARDVARKLGPQDRLIVPALQMLKLGQPIRGLALVMAAGLHYGLAHEAPLRDMLRQNGAVATFSRLSGLAEDHELCVLVNRFFTLLGDVNDPHRTSFHAILSSSASS